jgi:hypothetical protein
MDGWDLKDEIEEMGGWMDTWMSLWDCSTKDASYSALLATILFKVFHDKEDQNKLQLEL